MSAAVEQDRAEVITGAVFDLQDLVSEALGSVAAAQALPGLAEVHDSTPYPWPYRAGDLAYALALVRGVRDLVDSVASLVERAAAAAGVTGPAVLQTLGDAAAEDRVIEQWISGQPDWSALSDEQRAERWRAFERTLGAQ